MRRLSIFIPLALFPLAVHADTWQTKSFDLSLAFNHHKLPINRGMHEAELRLNSYLIKVGEPYGKRVSAGLLLGGIDARVRHLGHTNSIDTVGYHIGLGLDAEILQLSTLHLTTQLQLRYGDTDGSDDEQSIELNWFHSSAELRLSTAYTAGYQIYACGSWAHLSGEHTATGLQHFDRDLSLRQHGGYCAGGQLQVDDSGYIGLKLNRGNSDGTMIYFGRYFE